eukprot:scaffold55676_cov48-Attheya_sp.AAC.1
MALRSLRSMLRSPWVLLMLILLQVGLSRHDGSHSGQVLVQALVSPWHAAASGRRIVRTTTCRYATTQDRLTKARQLLEEFQVDPVDWMDTEQQQLQQKQQQQQQQQQQQNQNQKLSPDSAAEGDVVPDGFWSNGHLQGRVNGEGNNNNAQPFVTRWARGVKVAEPLVKYDPVAAEKLLFRQPTKWVVRNVQIAFPVGLWAVGVVWDFLLQKSNRPARARQLLEVISGLGPAIIKGGQALASRPDLLPSEYLEELQKLQDDVPRFSNELAFQTVEQELGKSFTDIFELIGTEPVAAASIGQVYKARLVSNGDLVALKIQRPRCEQIIALDLYVLRWWSGVYNKIFEVFDRDINVQSIIDDFGTLIYREIDYVAEAANAQRFSELYASIPDVFVPKVYSDLTTSSGVVGINLGACTRGPRAAESNEFQGWCGDELRQAYKNRFLSFEF